MSSNETTSTLENMSAAIRAATKLTNEEGQSEELTPEMLASAIKLAALSNTHQDQLTSASVNAAIKLAKKTSDQQQNEGETKNLTPESLAIALKLASKVSTNENNDNDEASTDQMLAAMKAAVVLSQQKQNDDLVTPELLSNALKLAKE